MYVCDFSAVKGFARNISESPNDGGSTNKERFPVFFTTQRMFRPRSPYGKSASGWVRPRRGRCRRGVCTMSHPPRDGRRALRVWCRYCVWLTLFFSGSLCEPLCFTVCFQGSYIFFTVKVGGGRGAATSRDHPVLKKKHFFFAGPPVRRYTALIHQDHHLQKDICYNVYKQKVTHQRNE